MQEKNRLHRYDEAGGVFFGFFSRGGISVGLTNLGTRAVYQSVIIHRKKVIRYIRDGFTSGSFDCHDGILDFSTTSTALAIDCNSNYEERSLVNINSSLINVGK